MKIQTALLLIIVFMFIGMSMNIPSVNDKTGINQEDLDNFEDGIINGDDDHKGSIIDIDPNVVNSTGQKVEGIIDSGFNYIFRAIKGFINDK